MANRVIFNRHKGRALDNKTRAEEGILGSALTARMVGILGTERYESRGSTQPIMKKSLETWDFKVHKIK